MSQHHVFRDDRTRWHPRVTISVVLGGGLAFWILLAWAISAL